MLRDGKVFYVLPTLKLKGRKVESYILLEAESGKIWSIAEAAMKVDCVKMAHAVTGQFDVVVYVEFPRMEDLGTIIETVQRIDGVRRTQTLTVIPHPVRK